MHTSDMHHQCVPCIRSINTRIYTHDKVYRSKTHSYMRAWLNHAPYERWGAGVETQKNVRGEIGGWGRVPFNEPLRPVVKYHLRRGVGLINFFENGTRPQPPTSPPYIHNSYVRHASSMCAMLEWPSSAESPVKVLKIYKYIDIYSWKRIPFASCPTSKDLKILKIYKYTDIYLWKRIPYASCLRRVWRVPKNVYVYLK